MSVAPSLSSTEPPRRSAFQVAADLFDPPTDPHYADPVGWVHGRLGEHLWSKQGEILESVRDHRYTAVRSAHSTGKSHIAARAIAWWISTRPDAFVVTSAPTAPQIKAILWRYIKRVHRAAGLPGHITDAEIPEWKIGGELVGWGRKPADLADAEQAMQAFQGIHARYVLVVLDEACGIPDWLWDAVDTLVTVPTNRVLAIGNPDDGTSRFAKVCAPGSAWHRLKISAYDAPAFTGEPVPANVGDLLVGREWVAEREEDWGRDSPLFISKVLAEFPEVSDSTVISLGEVRRAQERDLHADAGQDLIVIGCDVARTGTDETVIAERVGQRVRILETFIGQRTTFTSGRLREYAGRYPRHAVRVVVDDVGVGGGVTDQMVAWSESLPDPVQVIPFVGSERARRPLKFRNRRSELWFEAAAQLPDIDLDDDDRLAADLTAPRFSYDLKLRRVVERKEETKKRLGRSPDRGDAVLLTLVPEGVDVVSEPVHSRGESFDVPEELVPRDDVDFLTEQW